MFQLRHFNLCVEEVERWQHFKAETWEKFGWNDRHIKYVFVPMWYTKIKHPYCISWKFLHIPYFQQKIKWTLWFRLFVVWPLNGKGKLEEHFRPSIDLFMLSLKNEVRGVRGATIFAVKFVHVLSREIIDLIILKSPAFHWTTLFRLGKLLSRK